MSNEVKEKSSDVFDVDGLVRGYFTCLLCGREKFTRAGQPHRCHGGFRKRFKKEAERRGIENCFIPTTSMSREETKTGERL